MRSADLRLVSVWHPSFLELILDAIKRYWPGLIRDVAAGEVTLPSGAAARGDSRRAPTRPPAADRGLETVLRAWRRPDPARARALERAGPEAYGSLWPRLSVVSCWADGPSAGAATALRRRLSVGTHQPKGLLATEGVVTVPFGGAWPVAVRSHFLEFLDRGGSPHTVADLAEGEMYEVVLTTGAGLYRYRLGDRVRVEGFLERTPCLRFVGKEDRISDLCGEKLSDGFVAGVLEDALGPESPAFAMLAPDGRPDEAPGYTLFIEAAGDLPRDLAARLDAALSANPHYRYARRLGQLRPPEVFRVARGGQVAYLEREIARGARAGDVKATALSTLKDWSRHLEGAYFTPMARRTR